MKMRIQQFIAKLSVPRQGGVKDRLVFGDISVAVGRAARRQHKA